MRYRVISHIRGQAVGYLALFIALGGTGYAALVPNDSVGTKQLKNGAVTAHKLHNAAVTTAKIASGAVTGSKLNFSGVTVPNAKHATNSDRLGGAPSAAFHDRCPAGTVSAAAGLCVTSSDVATDSWFKAVQDCASRRMRLPSPAEAALLGRTTSSGYHWTNDFWFNGTSEQAMLFYHGPTDTTVGLDNIDLVSASYPVVCVITPSNS